jgi:hypothetical protein
VSATRAIQPRERGTQARCAPGPEGDVRGRRSRTRPRRPAVRRRPSRARVWTRGRRPGPPAARPGARRRIGRISSRARARQRRRGTRAPRRGGCRRAPGSRRATAPLYQTLGAYIPFAATRAAREAGRRPPPLHRGAVSRPRRLPAARRVRGEGVDPRTVRARGGPGRRPRAGEDPLGFRDGRPGVARHGATVTRDRPNAGRRTHPKAVTPPLDGFADSTPVRRGTATRPVPPGRSVSSSPTSPSCTTVAQGPRWSASSSRSCRPTSGSGALRSGAAAGDQPRRGAGHGRRATWWWRAWRLRIGRVEGGEPDSPIPETGVLHVARRPPAGVASTPSHIGEDLRRREGADAAQPRPDRTIPNSASRARSRALPFCDSLPDHSPAAACRSRCLQRSRLVSLAAFAKRQHASVRERQHTVCDRCISRTAARSTSLPDILPPEDSCRAPMTATIA